VQLFLLAAEREVKKACIRVSRTDLYAVDIGRTIILWWCLNIEARSLRRVRLDCADFEICKFVNVLKRFVEATGKKVPRSKCAI